MTRITLDVPDATASRLRFIADGRGATLETVALEMLGASPGNGNDTSSHAESAQAKRDRVNAAIDEAQRTFAHLSGPPFGDAVHEIEAAKRADIEREIARGL